MTIKSASEAIASWATNCIAEGQFRKAYVISKTLGHKTSYLEYLQGVLSAAHEDLADVNKRFNEVTGNDVEVVVEQMISLETVIIKLKEEIENESKV